jgi:hypothetical protein
MSSIETNATAQGSNHVNRRAFLAGGAVTTALIAGAVVLFTSLAAYVAFNGLSESEDEAPRQATVLVGTTADAPQAAAAALGRNGGGGDVAARPTAPTPVAPDPAAAPVAGTPALATPGTAAPTSTGSGIDTGTGTQEDVVVADPNQPGGALGNTVDDLDDATGNLGLDLPLNEVTDNITGPLDSTINSTLNNVGGLLGNPNLGDQVSNGLNSTTQNLLGEGGLTDQLLGGNR